MQVGPMSLDWPVNPFGRFESSRSSLSLDVSSGEQQRGAFPAFMHYRWRKGALHTQSQILQRSTGCDGCGPFLSEGLQCITLNTRCLVGSVSSDKGTEKSNSNISKDSWTQQHYLSPGSAWEGRISPGFPGVGSAISALGISLLDNENAGGSVICIHMDLLLEEAIVQNVIVRAVIIFLIFEFGDTTSLLSTNISNLNIP